MWSLNTTLSAFKHNINKYKPTLSQEKFELCHLYETLKMQQKFVTKNCMVDVQHKLKIYDNIV